MLWLRRPRGQQVIGWALGLYALAGAQSVPAQTGVASGEVALTVESPSRIQVEEHYQVPSGSSGVTFSGFHPAGTSIENLSLSSHGHTLDFISQQRGDWITIRANALQPFRSLTYTISYDIVMPEDAPLDEFDLPLVVASVPLQSVEVRLLDSARRVRSVTVPRLMKEPDGTAWSASLPGIPSLIHVQLTDGGSKPAGHFGSKARSTGYFFPNFLGLLATLASWCVVYCIWAYRYHEAGEKHGDER